MPRLKAACKIFFLFVLVLCGKSVSARQTDLFTSLSSSLSAEIASEVKFFSDSSLAGREFGSAGASGAAFYIYEQFRSAGFNTSFQNFSENGLCGHNVIAISPGKYSKYIVIGAYLDGFGCIDGVIYPGADSNASGLASLLSLARHFGAKLSALGANTGLIFIAFDAHHADMAGVRSFINKYLPLYPISLMVNLDTIGSDLAPYTKQRPDYLIALGGKAFADSLEWANLGIGLHLSYDYYGNKGFTELFYRRTGDQRHFLEKNIPSIMFTSGITLHTNKASDSADKLIYPLLVKRLRLIARWLEIRLKY